ncbi:hypothetical protein CHINAEXTREME_14655 [Halobiforma lacisalsi AJ5]|uniref:DUF7115 domain-containing protein n=1 Tax=Natronobacterium lacisalsi AJ5 TaxID=358396 RepID=M0L2E2_NATLA|nr:hypothetical protein [Halobiforma lacisalsi]APW98938.1 hypothetical protein CHINAEXTREME_14655 [Halobiforma lacisalsi AJ5]EMA27268.1 hypothetical protein C445_20780 [Halobiforma lacisalsi AJ5]
MNVPGIVQSALDGEEIAARVSLGGDDELFVTSSSTLVYRADGLLSDESVDEYGHEAERLTLSEGRRKTKFTLEYPLEGSREFAIPSGKTDAVLHPVLAGVLNGNDITDPGETVVQTYRFSELTLIVTSERLVKHIGEAVWDEDYEEYHFSDVTNLAFEDGSVATQIVLTVDGRPQRIKAPNDEANDLRERLKRALFDYHDVSSLEELNETVGGQEDDDSASASASAGSSSMDFGDGVDPLDADPPEPDDRETVDADVNGAAQGQGQPVDGSGQGSNSNGAIGAADSSTPQSRSTAQETATESTAGSIGSAENDAGSRPSTDEPEPIETGDVFETADTSTETADEPEPRTDPELLERIEALETAVERQSDLIEQQQGTIEQLIEELRQGR